MHEVPDLDCKVGNGIRRLDRYDQLAEYAFGELRTATVAKTARNAAATGSGTVWCNTTGSKLIS